MKQQLELSILRASIESRQDDIIQMDTPPILIDDQTSAPALFALGCAHASGKSGDRERSTNLLERALTSSRSFSIKAGGVFAIAQAGRKDLARQYIKVFLDQATEEWELVVWKQMLTEDPSFM